MEMQERRRKDDADNKKSHPEREREKKRERGREKSNEMGIDCRLFLVSFPSPSFLPLFFCAS